MNSEKLPSNMLATEKIPVQKVASLYDLCANINVSIRDLGMIYKCEVTIDAFPKTHVEYTIKWLSPVEGTGILMAQFIECSQPMRISLPLRIWTIL